MAKKKAALRGGGGGPSTIPLPQKKAARKTPKAKTGEQEPLVQKGIADVLEPKDAELEEDYRHYNEAVKNIKTHEDKKEAAYQSIKGRMRDKDITVYRLHSDPSKKLVFKSRDAEVKIEKIKKPKKSETANED